MRQEVYRVAFDEASAELSEILAKFEILRLRKDRVEKVVEALKPLIVSAEAAVPVAAPSISVERAPLPMAAAPVERAPLPMAAAPVEHAPVAAAMAQPPAPPAPGPIPYPVQQAVDESNDPFARRVENTIGLGSAARDVREYSRLFSTGSGR